MREYFKRLKEHPGLGAATLMSIMSYMAALSNKSIHSISGAIILGSIFASFFWLMVLISNFK